MPKITLTDILEIIILSFFLYHFILWIKKTRAWTLLKGLLILILFMCFATIMNLNTMLWIFKNAINVGIIAVIILFQPELRRALEELGRKNIISDVLIREDKTLKQGRLNDYTIQQIVAATTTMSKNKTGALIVIEQEVALGEYENTGINIDSAISKQLILNIFEHNTPLHDGAMIIRDNRILAATCYLPLTNRLDLNKELGTRHRAALGVSEVSDSLTIIVSEETGMISTATSGVLNKNIDPETLKQQLTSLQTKNLSETKKLTRRKGGRKHEKRDTK